MVQEGKTRLVSSSGLEMAEGLRVSESPKFMSGSYIDCAESDSSVAGREHIPRGVRRRWKKRFQEPEDHTRISSAIQIPEPKNRVRGPDPPEDECPCADGEVPLTRSRGIPEE
ncbi:UNVERIFIED_CONTAM: hypothetical protein PYX00_004066 [Menopon gallinae]|uniref:Uncharacterized protein n=1 Tax=Menopon gallinae TaxID=328185 RepID=A0AAW2I2A2_9NEOP